MRPILSTISAVVVSTSVAAAATQPSSQPMSHGNAMPASQAGADDGTSATPAHKSAAAMKAHAMSRRRVEEIQTALNKDGAQLAIDGVYGPKTRAAIEDFQKKNDLQATGRADHATLRKLQPQRWS